VQTGTFVQYGEHWTVGYGAASFSLPNALGLTYIQRLLQHPGEQIHVLDLLSGTAPSEIPETGASTITRFDSDDNVVASRAGDTGAVLDDQAKRDYRRRISELNEELNELRERGNLNLLGERDYQRRDALEFEIEALTRQLAKAVGNFGRDRRSGSVAERARLNVTRAIRLAIQRILERNAVLGELLGSRIRTGSLCAYVSDTRSPIEWKFRLEGSLTPTPVTDAPAFASSPSGADFIQTVQSTTAFVGREKERELLRRCLREVKDGRGRIVVIAGPPGIGKTRTAREAGDQARHQGFVALAGNCYDREDSVPFVPFVEVLEVVLARVPGPAAIREILGDQTPELSRLLPQLLRLFPDLPAPTQASPEQSRRMLFNAVLALVERQSALNPLLVLLEDLHWADEGTLSLLVHLARTISTLPVMIIATHRNDKIDIKPPLTKTLDELIRLGVVEQIPLGGLPERDVAQMIELLRGHEPSPALVNLVYSNTDGNPLFVEELIRDLVENQSNGDFVERLQQSEVALPHSLRLLIRRRLAVVSNEATRVLGTAAVIGRSFNFSLLEAATGAEPDRLVDSLEEAEKAGLISSRLEYPEARFKFAHELIRRAVLDDLSVARQQRVHLNIAEAMEFLHSDSLEAHAEDLAHHFWSAGASAENAKTIRYLQMAGQKALRSSANIEAANHLIHGLQLLATLPETPERLQSELAFQTNLGMAWMATKGYAAPETRAAYERARDLCSGAGNSPQLVPIMMGLAIYFLLRAEYRATCDIAERTLKLAEALRDSGSAMEAHIRYGYALFYMGEFEHARDHLERAIDLYDPNSHRSHALVFGQEPGMASLSCEALVLWVAGYPEQALARCELSMEHARASAHAMTLAFALIYASMLHQWLGRDETAEEFAAEAFKISSEQGLTFWAAVAALCRSAAESRSRPSQDAIAGIEDALRSWEATGARAPISYFRFHFAAALAHADHTGRAMMLVNQAIAELGDERFYQAELYRLKGELILQTRSEVDSESGAEAEACFLRALEIARRQNAKAFELRAARSLAALWRQTDRTPQAEQLLHEICGWFTEGFDTADLKKAKALLDQLN
jgi:predicted ATPase